jgi:hypothetical protein
MLKENGHTTSLLEIRRFLEAEKAAPSPWAEPSESLESLYALLVARRDDPLFWSRLQDLVLRLEDHRADLSRIGNSEAFGYATVEKLLEDLRADLCGNTVSAPISWKTALSSSLRATSLAAFLLLGAATASCGGDSEPDLDGLCDEAVANGVSGTEGEVYCDLVDIINGSTLSGAAKADLLDCLPDLDALYRAQLLDDFQTMDDAEIAAYLQEMLNPCGECNDTDCH